MPPRPLEAHPTPGLGRNLATAVAVLHRQRVVLVDVVITRNELTFREGLGPTGEDGLHVLPVRDLVGEGHRLRRAIYLAG